MITEHELYHGAALLKLISSSKRPVAIEPFAPSKSKSAYVINGKIGIYLKHSTLRMSPWGFTFQREHQDELAQMEKAFKDIFLLLICETDGVVILANPEIKTVLNVNDGGTQWITAKRGKREQYRIKGSNGELPFKIADSDYPKRLLVAIELYQPMKTATRKTEGEAEKAPVLSTTHEQAGISAPQAATSRN